MLLLLLKPMSMLMSIVDVKLRFRCRCVERLVGFVCVEVHGAKLS